MADPSLQPLLVDGVTGSPGGILEVNSPWDGQLLGRISAADRSTADRALANAAALFADRRRWLPAEKRMAILSEAARRIHADADSWALGIAREGGKPLRDARVEVARAVDGIQSCLDVLRTESGQEVPMNLNAASSGRWAFTRRVPCGVVLAFSAFNHPLNLIVHQVGPAVAAGCPVVIKPAESTPLTAFRFVQLLHDCGLPPDWVQCLAVRDLAVAAAMAADSRLDFFSFIGSARVGWSLRSRLAPGVRCALEHGGAAPVIVCAEANLDAVVPALTRGAFYHAGQVCVSVQRVFAEESIARPLADRLAAAAERLVVDDPVLETTDVGPLIRPAEFERVEAWMREAIEGGATLLSGGSRVALSAMRPAVLWNTPLDAKIMVQEVFGPVVSVLPVPHLDEAIRLANQGPYAFQSSIFTGKIGNALAAAERLEASAVIVNDPSTFRVDWMPFGGYRESGVGRSGIPHTYRDYTREKLVVLREG